MSISVLPASKPPAFITAIEQSKAKFNKTSLNFEAEKTFAIEAIRKNPDLLKSAQDNPQGIIDVMYRVAALNLSLNPKLNHLALYTRWNGKTRAKEPYLDIQWQGLRELAVKSGVVVKVASTLVYENDEFDWSMSPFDAPVHKADVFASDRGAIRGGYCLAVLSEGKGIQVEVMNITDILKCRDVSASKDDPNAPWNKWFEEMAKKTIFKRLFRNLPITTLGLADAIAYLNEDGGEGFAQGVVVAKTVDTAALPEPPDRDQVDTQILSKIDMLVEHAVLKENWAGVEDACRQRFKDPRILSFALSELANAQACASSGADEIEAPLVYPK